MKNKNIVGIDMISAFNESDVNSDNLFNFGYNEEQDHAYCDLFDHGVYRIFRDEDGQIIKIVLIRDGKWLEYVLECQNLKDYLMLRLC